jgi:hypothetical protein
MSFGRLLGAAGGFLLGGPAGAALGMGIGGAAEEAFGGGETGAIRDAAAQQSAATDRAIELQRRMYEEGVARQQPFLQTGTEFFNRLAELQRGGPSAAQNFLQMDPGYAFRLGEGMKALERSAAARGGLLSGATMKGLQRYGQDLASQEYGAAYNRLAGLANVGPRAAGVVSDLGNTYATSVGNMLTGQGTNQANALLAAQRARSSTYGQLGNVLGRYLNTPTVGGFNNAGINPASGEYYGSLEF